MRENSKVNKKLQTVTRISIHEQGDNPVFGESVTSIEIDDDAGGAYLVLKQCSDDIKPGEIRLDFEELDALTEASKKLFAEYTKAILEPSNEEKLKNDKVRTTAEGKRRS